MEHVIGIDLGTTYSCIAHLEEGGPVVIPNLEGLPTTPSVVSFTSSGERLVGTLAQRQALTNPQNTIFAVKRLIGRKFDSPEIAQARARLPYYLAAAPNGDVLVAAETRTLTPQEISAMILGYLKGCAESYFGEAVSDVVITVPAHFDDAQRQATKDAALISGFKVQRVINEPTAAGLAYGLNARKNGVAAVFDLGGGTFDFTLMEITDGVFNVLATNGDSYLGGEDFDNRIIEWLVEEFRQETSIDLHHDKLALQRIKEASERAKRELSFTLETEINLPFICSDQTSSKHLKKALTRQSLEAMTGDLVERTIPLIEKAFGEARLDLGKVDEVILVGGQTRMPLVKRRIGEFFDKKPAENINPDEIVAMGAAIQSGIIQGQVRGLVLLLDVTPFALGIETENDGYELVIEKNATIPLRKTKAFTTVDHNQRRVRLHVLQGENPLASLNKSLAVFELVGIEPAPAGVPQIDVTFEIDADGLVKVSARDVATNLQQKIEVRPSSGLTPGEVEALRKQQKREAPRTSPNG